MHVDWLLPDDPELAERGGGRRRQTGAENATRGGLALIMQLIDTTWTDPPPTLELHLDPGATQSPGSRIGLNYY